MRRVVTLILSMIAVLGLAQNRQLLYNVSDLPQTLLSNPGSQYHFDKYVGVPFLSSISASAGSSGLSVWDIFREGGDINENIETAILTLNNRDVFTANQQLELLSVGWLGRDEETFYSAGIYQETDFIVYFPNDWIELAYFGNANFTNRRFNFSDIAATAEVLTAYHFGVNKKLRTNLRVGARAKVYMSILNLNSTGNEGFFRTRPSPEGPNFFIHELVGANAEARISGINDVYDEGAGVLLKRALLSPNIGLGFDLGFTYDFSKQLSFTGSILDIGFIAHTTDLRNIRARGDFETSGIELQFEGFEAGQEAEDFFENFIAEFEENVQFEDFIEESYVTLRPLKVNAGVHYGYGKDRRNVECNCLNKKDETFLNSIGFHLNAIKRPRSVLAAATISYDRSWASFLKTRFTYTLDSFSSRNLGLLVSTKIKNFNFYLAADNLLEYADVAKAQELSVQMGMQVVINTK